MSLPKDGSMPPEPTWWERHFDQEKAEKKDVARQTWQIYKCEVRIARNDPTLSGDALHKAIAEHDQAVTKQIQEQLSLSVPAGRTESQEVKNMRHRGSVLNARGGR